MTTLDEREKGFERKFVNDQELEFRAARSRRNRLLGEWAGHLMGLKNVEDYAKAVVRSPTSFSPATRTCCARSARTSPAPASPSTKAKSAPRWTNSSPSPAARSKAANKASARGWAG